MKKTAIILVSETSLALAQTIAKEMEGTEIYTKSQLEGCTQIHSYSRFVQEHFMEWNAWVFIGALGICVRSIAPCIMNKYTDPAVLSVDSTGRFVIPVLSGHIGGANELSRQIAAAVGAEAVITTQSDNTDLWALDTLGTKYGWKTTVSRGEMNRLITLFVNKKPTALLLETKDDGTAYLERSLPEHVRLYTRFEEIPQQEFALLIAVTPFHYPTSIPTLCYRPAVLHIGVGCQKNISPEGIPAYMEAEMEKAGLSPLSVASVASIELKKDEPLLKALHQHWPEASLQIYTSEALQDIEVPHPSEKVYETTGVYGVAEATAIKSADGGRLLIEKQKGMLAEGEAFTFAVALDVVASRVGHIEIVGAGPGDPDLISVKGRRFLEQADLILYAGSLVPRELTFCAKKGALIRSSASLTLEEQFELMKKYACIREILVFMEPFRSK